METVLTTAEANAIHGRARVRHQLARGHWQRRRRGVVITHNGTPTFIELLVEVLKSGPAESALAGVTALILDGLTGFTSRLPQIVLPMGARPLDADDVEVHWSKYLDERDVHPSRAPRRTRPARSVIDAASWCASDRLARAIVIAALQQGLTSTRHLREALVRRGMCHRRALVVESILDAAGGVQSLPERDAGDIFARAGLTISRQRPVRGPDGRFYLDVYVEELGLAVEIHGIPHLAVQQWDKDLFRANEIVIGGERLLIFSSYAVRHEQDAVVDQLRRAAAALRET